MSVELLAVFMGSMIFKNFRVFYVHVADTSYVYSFTFVVSACAVSTYILMI